MYISLLSLSSDTYHKHYFDYVLHPRSYILRRYTPIKPSWFLEVDVIVSQALSISRYIFKCLDHLQLALELGESDNRCFGCVRVT